MSKDKSWVLWPTLILAALAATIGIAELNTVTFLWLNAQTAMLPDGFWAVLTSTAENAPALTVLLLLARDRPQTLWAGLLAGAFGGALIRLLKVMEHWPRPAVMLDPTTFHIIGPILRHNAFPSGHAFTAFALAAVLVFGGAKPHTRWILLALASLVAISRVAVGAHWPFDVLVGATLGWLVGWGASMIARRSTWAIRGTGRKVVLGIYILAAYAALVTIPSQPSADAMLKSLALVGVFYGLYRLYWLLVTASSRMRWQKVRSSGRSTASTTALTKSPSSSGESASITLRKSSGGTSA